ncbi:MAG: stage II sporulation protein E [Hyphomonadaceae bacterium]|nr:stage II sporulation protein E [Clostridia bacterium]
MDTIEILPYKRISKQANQQTMPVTKRFAFVLNKLDFLYGLMGLMIGQAAIFNISEPFCVAFLVAVVGSHMSSSLFAVVGVLVGAILTAGFVILPKYLLMGIVFVSCMTLMRTLKIQQAEVAKATLAAIAFFSVGCLWLMLGSFLMYDFMVLVVNAIVVFLCTYLFTIAMPTIFEPIKRINREQCVSVIVLLCIIILGLPAWKFFGLFSLRNVCSIWFLLYFSYKQGAAYGTTVGLLMGVLNGIGTDNITPVICSYAISGMFAGMFNRVGKTGSALGFLLSNALFTLFLNGSSEVVIRLTDTILSIVMFASIPHQPINAYIARFINVNRKSDGREDKIKTAFVNRLHEIGCSFEKVAQTVNGLAYSEDENTDNTTISAFIEKVAGKVCASCVIRQTCWERDFHHTYKALFNSLEVLERKGKIAIHDLPSFFVSRCIHRNDFIATTNTFYEIDKIHAMCATKVNESRTILSEQIKCMQNIIESVAEEVSEKVINCEDKEQAIYETLDRNTIAVSDVNVIRNQHGNYTVEIMLNYQTDGRMNMITDAVSKILHKKMVRIHGVSKNKSQSGEYIVKLTEQETFEFDTGVSVISKYRGDKCGDYHTAKSLGNGKFLLAISDGMGSGKKAALESETTITLLENLLSSGFDHDNAIKMINSVLYLKSPEESFATVDLSIVDMYQGNAEFIKIGAASTFLVTEKEIDVLCCSTMPIGMMQNIDMDHMSRKLKSGDVLVMVTDGVLDAAPKDKVCEIWFSEMLQSMDFDNPQKAAQALLHTVQSLVTTHTDDMTIMVSKLQKKQGKENIQPVSA